MKKDKRFPNARLVKLEEIADKNLIPVENIFYRSTKDNKFQVYIFNKAKSKLKTFEDFKNKVDRKVEFKEVFGFEHSGYFVEVENEKKPIFSHMSEELVTYVLEDEFDEYEVNAFTTTEEIEKFIAKHEAILKSEKAEQDKKQENLIQ